MLIEMSLLAGVYLGAGCAVAAGSWDSVRRRHPTYPATKLGVVGLILSEAARWPLTIAGK